MYLVKNNDRNKVKAFISADSRNPEASIIRY
jgi:hypothetical protein